MPLDSTDYPSNLRLARATPHFINLLTSRRMSSVDNKSLLERPMENIPAAVSLPHFLETYPPGKEAILDQSLIVLPVNGSINFKLSPIEIFCESEKCDRVLTFDPRLTDIAIHISEQDGKDLFLEYYCRHCRVTSKRYALRLSFTPCSPLKMTVSVVKYGEQPAFTPYISSRVLSFAGKDRDYFLKARRAESLGMGIASFVYFRRVVENQKSRLIAEIAKVAEHVKVDAATIATLKMAQEEKQFSKAITLIKDAIPETLRIEGNNPLTLLHDALSDGLHAQTDEECLFYATSIRLILNELYERISVTLKEHAELKSAVNRLLNRNRAKKIEAPQES